MTEQEPDLVEQLRRRVTEWVLRVAPRIRDERALAKLEITLHQPQGDDDGTLYLDFEIVETTVPDNGGGRETRSLRCGRRSGASSTAATTATRAKSSST